MTFELKDDSLPRANEIVMKTIICFRRRILLNVETGQSAMIKGASSLILSINELITILHLQLIIRYTGLLNRSISQQVSTVDQNYRLEKMYSGDDRSVRGASFTIEISQIMQRIKLSFLRRLQLIDLLKNAKNEYRISHCQRKKVLILNQQSNEFEKKKKQ